MVWCERGKELKVRTGAVTARQERKELREWGLFCKWLNGLGD